LLQWLEMSVLIFIIGILLFIGLVVVHEFGHFIMARRGGVEVEEVGIFFPPRLFKYKTKAGWLFTINLLPLGGFVKLKGENDSDTTKGSFGAASLKVKTKIMAAGVVMNLITALVLFTIIAIVGMPKLVDNQFTVKSNTQLVKSETKITYIEPGSPADKAGLKYQDNLISLRAPGYSPVSIVNSKKLPQITKSFAGKTVDIIYSRDGKTRISQVTLLSKQQIDDNAKKNIQKGYLGIIPADFVMQRSTWSAPIVAVGLTAQFTQLTFQALGHSLAGLGGIIAGSLTGNSQARQHGQTAADHVERCITKSAGIIPR